MRAIKKGNIAPPTIPVSNMPVKVPWLFFTEFKPREITNAQIPESVNPINLNDKIEYSRSPKSATRINTEDDKAYDFSKIFPSKILIRIRDPNVPNVKFPQNPEMTSTPTWIRENDAWGIRLVPHLRGVRLGGRGARERPLTRQATRVVPVQVVPGPVVGVRVRDACQFPAKSGQLSGNYGLDLQQI